MDSLTQRLHTPIQQPEGDPYLHLQLDGATSALFPMQYAQEVLVLPGQRLTAMPGMPRGVLGLINRRSRIYWLADLALVLGLSPLASHLREYNVALVRIGPMAIGLAVQQVKGVVRFPAHVIQAPEARSPGLDPYLQGVILQPAPGFWVLAAEAIARSPLLAPSTSWSGH